MADRLSLITREIERVVTAPYIPVLQDLQELVLDSPQNVLKAWAECKPCQVALLAQKLLEAVPCSSASLPLICAFASIRKFCAALVEKQPALLDQLLQKAIDNRDSQSFQTCIAMLSHPLPVGVMLPARVSTFVERLIQNMVDKPSAETIHPLYQIIGGIHGSSSLLTAFSEETMASFQTECTKILRNLDDHMGNLLCLATFARISAAQTWNSSLDRGNDNFPSWLQNLRQFFGPKRASKTLDLVVLRVILACSANFNMSAREAVESIRLAMEICDAVDPDQRVLWIEGNNAKIAKLREKVGRQGIDQNLQVMGLAFLVSFLSTGNLPEDLRTTCKQALLSDEGRRSLQELPEDVFRTFVAQAITYLDEAAISNLLEYALSLIKDDKAVRNDALDSIQILIRIFSAVRQSNLGHLSSGVNRFLCKTGTECFSTCMKSFPISCQICCEGTDICGAAFISMQNALFADLVFLCSTVSGCMDNRASSQLTFFPILASFFSKATSNMSENCNCLFSNSNQPTSANMALLNTTPPVQFEAGASKDWRSKMAETIMQNAYSSSTLVIREVEEICRDLEYRCHNVEAPLRDMTEERDQLVLEVEGLKRHKRELDIQVDQSSHAISTLQEDITRLQKKAQNASIRAQDLETQLAAARKELEEEKQDSQDSILSEREKARSKELDLMATLTEREDQLEELQNELHQRNSENEKLRETIDTISKKNMSASETAASLRREVEKLQQSLEDKISDNKRMDGEIKALSSDREIIRCERDGLQNKLESEVSELNKLRIALREEEESNQSKVAMLEQQHQSEISRLTEQALQETSRLTEENNVLRMTIQAVETKASVERKESNRKIQKLQQKLESLRNERAAKARESSEAQEYINRLMSVMGFKDDRRETAKTPSKGERSKPTSKTSGFREPHDLTGDDAQLGVSFESTASSSCSPTPKRPRSSRRSRALSHTSFDDGCNDQQSKKTRERYRQPLGECDRNSPAKSSQRTSKGAQDKEGSTQLESQIGTQLAKQQLENLSLEFSEEDIFTSTATRLQY